MLTGAELDLEADWALLRVRWEMPPILPAIPRYPEDKITERMARQLLGRRAVMGLLDASFQELTYSDYERKWVTIERSTVATWHPLGTWPLISGLAVFDGYSGECLFVRRFTTVTATNPDKLTVTYKINGLG